MNKETEVERVVDEWMATKNWTALFTEGATQQVRTELIDVFTTLITTHDAQLWERMERKRTKNHDNLIAHPATTGEEWEHHDPRWSLLDISAEVADGYNQGITDAQALIKPEI
jgi:hypothetical protein